MDRAVGDDSAGRDRTGSCVRVADAFGESGWCSKDDERGFVGTEGCSERSTFNWGVVGTADEDDGMRCVPDCVMETCCSCDGGKGTGCNGVPEDECESGCCKDAGDWRGVDVRDVDPRGDGAV